jgi:ABC-type polysaccharide/polyol phosphate export permease
MPTLLTEKLTEISSRRELFVNLTLRELRSKYKRSVLGWAWSLLNPLTTLVIYSVVFGVFLKVQPDVGDPSGLHNFAMFLMCGLLPFNFMSNGLNGGMTSLIGNDNLVKKVYFPREILVAAVTASWVVSFLIELAVLACVLVFFGNIVLMWVPMVLVLVAIQVVFVYGLALMLSAAAVYFRDLQHLLGIVLQVWMYSAPIVYPLRLVEDEVGPGWMTLYNLNPLTRFVEAYRDLLYDLRFPPVADIAYLVGVAAAALVLGQWVFWRLEGRLAEEL